ncbi:MAG: hypothetical protein NWQ07_01470 [Flaviramulus sp.]|nr:hypothetical protein [Flaviramulus sp.]
MQKENLNTTDNISVIDINQNNQVASQIEKDKIIERHCTYSN